MPTVAILMGSRNDWDIMHEAAVVLDQFGVSYDVQALSAHRTPAAVTEYVTQAEDNGIQVIIAGAGAAAHLPGVIAGQTTLPVLGVPISATALNGMDALLAIAQMPGGIPVGTLAIGKAGAKNAGLLAVAILALSNPSLSEALKAYRQTMAEGVYEQNARLQNELKHPAAI
jgi:5-(carboxyamino)imidazole ribonucleotide mutase